MNCFQITPLIAQLPAPAPGDLERWAFSAATVATLVVLGKKLFNRKPPVPADFVTRAEFQQDLSALRDKIDARFLALSEKLAENHKELLAALDRQATRLNSLEAGLARVDERTKRPTH